MTQPIDDQEKAAIHRRERRDEIMDATLDHSGRSAEVDLMPWESEPHPAERAIERSTDIGNALRFAAMHGDRLRYVHARGRWLAWDGRRWRGDDLGAEVVAAKAVVGAIFAEAAALSSLAATGDEQAGARAESLTKWARASSKAGSIRAMLSLAQSETPLAAAATMFDGDRFALNVMNGTIDLRSGRIRPHRPTDMITMLAPVTFDIDAVAPGWERFLARVLPDLEVRDWVQRYLGYALTGDVREQVLVFAHGAGANGKSVLLDVMLGIVGDYGLRAPPELVLAKYGESHPTDVASLEGRRLVVCSEIEQGRAWAESTIKRITGDTSITARKMKTDFYTFPATHKLVIAANTKPTVRGTDNAIWRRMRLVPFEVTIPEHERDKELVSRLLAKEAAGILAWAVRGCIAWQRKGLGEPAAIAAATSGYRADQDVIGQWIEDECALLEGAWTSTEALYRSYTSWCEGVGHEPWKRNTLRDRLLERAGLFDYRKMSARGVGGIALRAERPGLTVVR